MSFDHKHRGDAESVGEELMTNVSELEEKGAVVEKAVKDGYFSLPEALIAYRLSEIEYFAYLLLRNKDKLEAAAKEKQVVNAVWFLVETFQAPSASFAPAGQQVMQKLKNIVGSPPLSNEEVDDFANAW